MVAVLSAIKAVLGRFSLLWKYYGVGAINTAFGYSLYSVIIFLGVNLFIAQLISHCTGVVFNYFMFKKHVFKGTQPNIVRYIGAYIVNYFIGLGALYIVSRFFHSPYIAGFIALLIISTINFFVLRYLVFLKTDGRN